MNIELYIGAKCEGRIIIFTQTMHGLVHMAMSNPSLDAVYVVGYLVKRGHNPKLKVINGEPEENRYLIRDSSIDYICFEENFGPGRTAAIISFYRRKLKEGGCFLGPLLDSYTRAGLALLGMPYLNLGKGSGWISRP